MGEIISCLNCDDDVRTYTHHDKRDAHCDKQNDCSPNPPAFNPNYIPESYKK